MSSIPEEIHLEILLRVAARSTYACKCVCKSWLRLISNPNFFKRHLNYTLQKNKHNLMLRRKEGIVDFICTISKNGELFDETDVIQSEYPFQFDSKYHGFELLGSCNGLVALRNEEYYYFEDDYCVKEILRIWNPITREIKKLPKSPNAILQEEIGIFAFGYDYKTDDYKLAKVVENEDVGSFVDIYTLGKNSWKTIDPIFFKFPFIRVPGVLVHGDLHWLGETCGKDVSNVIVSFNISDERFGAIQLPKQSLENNYSPRSVGLLKGCLCMLAHVVVVGIEIWVMQEYGVQESWTKLYVLSHECFLNDRKDYLIFLSKYKYIRLLLSFKSGEILLVIPKSLVIFDPKRGSLRECNTSIPSIWYESDGYFESLVPIHSGSYYVERLGGEEEEEEDEEEEEVEDEEEDEA